VNPDEWDEEYAAVKYLEMKMPGKLTGKQGKAPQRILRT
jgi:hypothetical protein